MLSRLTPTNAAIATAVLTLIPGLFLFGNANITPPGKTGAPGENTCAECHSSLPNTRSGRVTADFATLLTYTPGVRQQITVRITPNLQSYNATGFQATARLSNNAIAGHFEPGQLFTAVQVFNGQEYVNHSAISADRSYTFFWTPPATNAGNITIYIAGVAGPGDGVANALDDVYTTSYTLRPATSTVPSGYQWTFPAVPGTSSSSATGISSNGRIVGTYTSGTTKRGFLRNADGTTELIDAPGATSTIPTGVNASGVVVGIQQAANGAQTGFMRSATGTYSAFTVPNASTTITAITDAGDMVGTVNAGQVVQGVRLSSNLQITENLVRPPLGVNASGVFTGTGPSTVATDARIYGYLQTRDGAVTTFPSPCSAQDSQTLGPLGINDNNDVVGGCTSQNFGADPEQQAFLRLANSRVIRLSTGFTTGGLGPVSAGGISNSGQVAATGYSAVGGTLKAMLLNLCPTTVTQGPISAPGTGGTFAVNLTTAGDCHWLATSDSDWITVVNDTGAGNSTVTFNVAANTSPVVRTGTVTIGGNPVTVTQDAVACTFTFTTPSLFLASTAITTATGFIAPSGCTWTATSNVSWITFPNGNTGTGTGSITIFVAANNGTLQRTGAVTLGTSQFFVTQAPSLTCGYTVSQAGSPFIAAGGIGAINVITGDGCSWSATSGSTWITVDGGTRFGSGVINFTVAGNSNGDRVGSVLVAGQSITIVQQGGSSAPIGLRFVTVTPCRIADTRIGSGTFGAPRITGGATREFPIPSSACNIPFNARAYSLNITAVPPGQLAFITTWATGQPMPLASTLNSFNGRVVANAAIVPAGVNGSISIFASNDTDIVIDINGYFVPADTLQGLAFYPLTPCRVADTRPNSGKGGEFGAPSLAGGNIRSFNIVNSGCGVPSNAQAFSMNVTAVPPGALAFVTVWPAGQTQPLVSTLNSFDGQVVPNAAIVPAGVNGAINVFASNNTDIVLDINGYFAPPFQPGALSFYPMNPCRIADTRPEGNQVAPFGVPRLTAGSTRTYPIPSHSCGVPASAQAYSLNLTAVPPGPLSFVTIWPSGLSQPLVSTLNSFNGQVVANAALVPAGTSGGVNVFAASDTDLVIDINGYFAP